MSGSKSPTLGANQDILSYISNDAKSVLEQFRAYLRANHMSFKTETSYVGWVIDLIRYHHFINPRDMNTSHIEHYLNHLVLQHNIDIKTQRSALNALIGFFVNFLGRRLNTMNLNYVKRRKALAISQSSERKLQILFAAALLQAGYDWQTIRVLLGSVDQEPCIKQ